MPHETKDEAKLGAKSARDDRPEVVPYTGGRLETINVGGLDDVCGTPQAIARVRSMITSMSRGPLDLASSLTGGEVCPDCGGELGHDNPCFEDRPTHRAVDGGEAGRAMPQATRHAGAASAAAVLGAPQDGAPPSSSPTRQTGGDATSKTSGAPLSQAQYSAAPVEPSASAGAPTPSPQVHPGQSGLSRTLRAIAESCKKWDWDIALAELRKQALQAADALDALTPPLSSTPQEGCDLCGATSILECTAGDNEECGLTAGPSPRRSPPTPEGSERGMDSYGECFECKAPLFKPSPSRGPVCLACNPSMLDPTERSGSFNASQP
jgi:hypothetical protein